jgi:hypothetical protein
VGTASVGEPATPSPEATAAFDIRRPVEDGLQNHVLVISGWMAAGSAGRVQDVIRYDVRNGLPVDAIEMDSAGGDAIEAERMGGIIRASASSLGASSSGVMTMVAPGAVCEGACALAFLGGTTRRVADDGVYAVSPISYDDVAGEVAARTDLSLYARAPYLTPEQIDLWQKAVASGDIDPFSGMIYADLDVVREDTITNDADRADNAEKRARLRTYNTIIDALEHGRENELPGYARAAERTYATSAARLGAYVGSMTGDTALVTEVMLQSDRRATGTQAQAYRRTVRKLLRDNDVADDQMSALLSVPEAREAAALVNDTPLVVLDAGALARYGVVTPMPAPSPATSLPCSGSVPSCRP